MKRKLCTIGLIAIAILALTNTSYSNILYAIDATRDKLFRIDLLSEEFVEVGSLDIDVGHVEGIAFLNRTELLCMFQFYPGESFYVVNLKTGKATYFSDGLPDNMLTEGLARNGVKGDFYVSHSSSAYGTSDVLGKVDPETGAMSDLCTLGTDMDQLFFNSAGTLYAVNNGPPYWTTDFYQIDPGTCSLSLVYHRYSPTWGNVSPQAFLYDGELVGMESFQISPYRLVELDVSTGDIVQTIMNLPSDDYNITFVAVFDSDADGVYDDQDNCAIIYNPSQLDNELDGTGDACDPDDDNDGVSDVGDNCPFAVNPEQLDSDGDGTGDACDNCPMVMNPAQMDTDTDGIGNACDNCLDVPNPDQNDNDGDGTGDACEADSDSDGYIDDVDNCPAVANPDQADSDDDGIGDVCDNCLGVINVDQADNDDDGIGNACDNCLDTPNVDQTDTDDDFIGHACDNCVFVPNNNQADNDGDNIGNACDNCLDVPNPDQNDNDGDGTGDACEADSDSDGYIDDVDNCPAVANPDQADSDDDGIGDVCDNCLEVYNPDQEDSNGNGIGDACDFEDSDGDGIADADDNCPFTPQWAVNAGLLDANGCVECSSLESYVDLQCPSSGDWKNHGKYVSCVSGLVEPLKEAGQVTEECAISIISERARSDVGKPNRNR